MFRILSLAAVVALGALPAAAAPAAKAPVAGWSVGADAATVLLAKRGRGADDGAGHVRGGKGKDDGAGHDKRRPRVPGGSGCDDPRDLIEHPECRG